MRSVGPESGVERCGPWFQLACAVVVVMAALTTGCAPGGGGGDATADAETDRDADWPVYLGDSGRRHYSPLTQLDKTNVASLKEVWTYDSGELRGSASTMYTSPLVEDGVLYGLSPKLVAFALDAATGEEIWRTDLGLAGTPQRGLMLWRGSTEEGDAHRVFFTHGKDLHALDAGDGSVVDSFGDGGKVDLTPQDESGEPLPGPLFVSVPGVVFEDMIILGFSTSEDSRSHRGSIRAFSAVDGALVWQFDTIPKPGDPGSETWAEGSLEHAGGANVWTGMALDEERGLLFAPTGSATPDFYGASRLGDNLFSDSLVTLDARTGELEWYFQVVRHDLWDKDNPAPPTLVEVERDGRTIDAVALTTKTGQLFLFERETGESLYEITELATPIPSTLPGEVTAPSQPESAVKISRQHFEVTDRTPEATAFVEEQIKDWDLRPWAPPRGRHPAVLSLVRRWRRVGRLRLRAVVRQSHRQLQRRRRRPRAHRGARRLQRLRPVRPALRQLPRPRARGDGCWYPAARDRRPHGR